MQWLTTTSFVSRRALCVPQHVAESAFLPVEPAVGFLRAVRRVQSSHAYMDKPYITEGFRSVGYPHLVWPPVEAVYRGVAVGHATTSWSDIWVPGGDQRWTNCPWNTSPPEVLPHPEHPIYPPSPIRHYSNGTYSSCKQRQRDAA